MKITRLGAGVAAAAAAALVAAPAVANAADTPVGGADAAAAGLAVQINAPELTATEADGITTVTFTPDSVGGDRHCMGPQVFDATAAQAEGDGGLPGTTEGQIGAGIADASNFAIPKGFVAANQALIEQYVDAVYHEGAGPSREQLAQAGAAAMLGPFLSVGEELGQDSGNPFAGAVPSDFMERTAEHNAFGYELNPDHGYLAMASCATGDPVNDTVLTDQKASWTYINTPAFDSGAANQVTEFKPGATVMVQFTGLQPGAAYSEEGNSTPFCTLDDVRADDSGALAFVCTLPADLEAGTHHFHVKDSTGTVASIEFTVAADGADQGLLSAAAEGTGGDNGNGDGDNGNGDNGDGGDTPGDDAGTGTGTGSLGSLFGSLGGSK